MQIVEDFIEFLDASPTVFHAAREIAERLAKAGFKRLREEEAWKIERGENYFLMKGDSLVAAFKIPEETPTEALILASHIDSPSLKIKPEAVVSSHGVHQLLTETYGSPILHSWFDRDLYLAGRISCVDNRGKRASHLVKLEEALIIPELALHLDRTVSEKGVHVNKQDHLKPVFSLKENALEKWLKKACPFKTLLAFDLFLVPKERAAVVGFESELIASHKLDNLTSAYAALYAMIHAKERESRLQTAFFWDHEEIGSMSYVGADSRFAEEVFERISLSLNIGREDFFRLKSRSLCLSGDLAHGFHPSYADKYDPENAPFLGKGPVLKFNANQKYATSSESGAKIVALAAREKIPLQKFASRSDIPSGSTLGSILASQLGIETVDLGIAGWAMHSIREVVAAKDEEALCHLFKAALESV
jgi:aspartyl aminopeptidase